MAAFLAKTWFIWWTVAVVVIMRWFRLQRPTTRQWLPFRMTEAPEAKDPKSVVAPLAPPDSSLPVASGLPAPSLDASPYKPAVVICSFISAPFYFCSVFFSAACFFASTVHGGTIPFSRA
jgi:hypothetical protein